MKILRLQRIYKTSFPDLNKVFIFNHGALQAVRRKTAICYIRKILFQVKNKMLISRYMNYDAMLILLETQVTQ